MESYNFHKDYFDKNFCSDLVNNYSKFFTFDPRPGWNSWTISDTEYKELLLTKIKGIYPENLINSWINISVYEPGYFLKLHTDSRSEFTVVVNLNDDYKGGETELVGIKKIKPEIGKLLLFKNGNMLHKVNKVKINDRYTLGGWYV